MEKFTAYRLVIDNHFEIKRFLTKDPAEVKIKAMEVMQDNQQVTLHFSKFLTTSDLFFKELQEIIS